ncbi:pilus assembly protein TadG-related protein [Halomonas sp. 328]|uniref:pilus assembly protein TadG-related protein n=1 Tax=Halomonas sp. 328 TaxID=2776704 RepID=UPI0018A74CDF|nr:pilus assembly protein TadG-related protein [Halomonas sp. 328]MBF8221321.1 hypothetical protein [Halomonas sp. 328]
MSFYRREAGPRRQRGAIGLMAAFVLLLMISCIALALDTGRLYMEKRNLQRIADLAALEVAGRSELSIAHLTDDELTAAAVDAVANNSGASRSVVISGEGKDSYIVGAQGGGLCLRNNRREFHPVENGIISCETLSGELSGVAARQAIQVTVSLKTSASLIPALMGSDDVPLVAQATAQQKPREDIVSFSIGSRLLSTEGDGLLGALFGEDFRLDAAGYQGLANTSISLLDLIDLAADVGTGDGLLQGVALKLSELASLEQLDAVVRGDDNAIGLSVSLFQDALNQFVGLGLSEVELADIVALDPTASSEALNAQVSLASLLEVMAFVGDGAFINVEDLGVSLGGLGGVSAELRVIEPPQIAVGPIGCSNGSLYDCDGEWVTEASTGQVKLGLATSIGISALATVDLMIEAVAGGARAGVDNARVDYSEQEADLEVAAYHQPVGTRINVGLSLLSSSSSLASWMDEGEVDSWSGYEMTPSPASVGWDYGGGAGVKEVAFTSANNGGDLADALVSSLGDVDLKVKVWFIEIDVSAEELIDALSPVISDLVDSVISPIFSLLGLSVGEADVRIIDFQPGSVGGAELVL